MMNAYELADQLDNVKYQNGAKPFEMYANMLRQQADRIAELEKEVEECWCGGHSYAYLRAKNRLPQTNPENIWTSCSDCGQRVTGDSIHTCSPQLKPLSDEEIKEVWLKRPANTAEDVVRFARAIEERHGIK